MSNEDQTDRDLREIFAAVRREEEAQTPPIPRLSLTARKPGRRRLSGKLAAATCLAAVIAAAVWLLPASRVAHVGPNRGREQTAASIASWKPATDFLLDTPGRELLEDVPRSESGLAYRMRPAPAGAIDLPSNRVRPKEEPP